MRWHILHSKKQVPLTAWFCYLLAIRWIKRNGLKERYIHSYRLFPILSWKVTFVSFYLQQTRNKLLLHPICLTDVSTKNKADNHECAWSGWLSHYLCANLSCVRDRNKINHVNRVHPVNDLKHTLVGFYSAIGYKQTQHVKVHYPTV